MVTTFDIDSSPSTVIMMTTVFHESSSTIHDVTPIAVKDGVSSAAVTNGAQYDYYYGDAAVLIASLSFADVSRASPSIVIDTESSTVSVASNKASSAGNDSLATVTIMTTVFVGRTSDNDSNLYFDTIIWLMYIHVIDEYLYITGVCCRTKWVQSPEWVFPLNEWIFP